MLPEIVVIEKKTVGDVQKNKRQNALTSCL
jgi:hypothetical protein